MVEKSITRTSVFPSEDDIKAWEALSRDEQIEQMKVELDDAYNSGVSELTRDEIKARAKARLAAKNVK